MNHRESIRKIARRLPHIPRHTVAEVLEVASEVWSEELTKPGAEVALVAMGKLYVEVHEMKIAGAIQERLKKAHGTAPKKTKRFSFRLHPSGKLRKQVQIAHRETEESEDDDDEEDA